MEQTLAGNQRELDLVERELQQMEVHTQKYVGYSFLLIFSGSW